MKLIYCPICLDIVKLRYDKRTCGCGASWGRYLEDGLRAEIGGQAVPLAFDNTGFYDALKRRPESGYGPYFNAWVIARDDPHVRYETPVDDAS